MKQKIEVHKHKTSLKVFLNSKLKRLFIGEIQGETLRVYDDDNYHELSKSLGIDLEIIISPIIKYRWIHFHFENYDYITSRTYLYHKGTKQNMFNGRDYKFLPLTMFGQVKAMEWEDYMDNLETAQLDLFTILDEQRKTNEENNEYLREWEDKNKQVQQYRIKQQKLVL